MTDSLVVAEGEVVGARVEGARHAGEEFEHVRLVDVELVRCDLSGASFSEGVWHRVTLVDCRATGVDLSQVSMRNVMFTDCKLDDANIRLAKLHTVHFKGCVLAAADFTASSLDDVRFGGCDLAGAEFSKVRCKAVDFRDARLDGVKGVASLGGSIIGVDQLFGFAPALARALRIDVRPSSAEED